MTFRLTLLPRFGKTLGMKQHYIQYTQDSQPGPMSYWVHVPTDGRPWYDARPRATRTFEPPLPRLVPGKGFPRYFVEFDDFTFEFASLAELDRCIATLEQKNLPHTERETTERHTGPGAHWLNKLPGSVKSWHYRSRAVKYLHRARHAFAHDCA